MLIFILKTFRQKNYTISIAKEAIDKSCMNIVSFSKYEFKEGGFTKIFVLEESHFSIHTYPERNYISIDCYACGDNAKPLSAVTHFIERLEIARVAIKYFSRGVVE